MIDIRQTQNEKDFTKCALLMSQSDPWIRLQMSFGKCMLALEDDFKEVYVAYDSDKFIGFAILQMKGVLSGYIQSICIQADFRNRGNGTMILRFCEERIFKDSPNSFICYSSFNPDAGKLYTKLGYQLIGELKNFIVNGESEILLRKTIGSKSDFIPRN